MGNDDALGSVRNNTFSVFIEVVLLHGIHPFSDMTFEFDPAKSAATKADRGVEFVEAQQLWLDPNAIELPARSEAEPRKMLIASMGGKVWSSIFTKRGATVRIISVRAHTQRRSKFMSSKTKTTSKNLEQRFEQGEDVLDYFDLSKASKPNLTPQKVNVDFPAWVVSALDREANRHGVPRQSLIKVWIVERLEKAG